jgi:hypothetical protein
VPFEGDEDVRLRTDGPRGSGRAGVPRHLRLNRTRRRAPNRLRRRGSGEEHQQASRDQASHAIEDAPRRGLGSCHRLHIPGSRASLQCA